jgi:hypothetical protein
LNFALSQNGAQIKNGRQNRFFSHNPHEIQKNCILSFDFCQVFDKPQFMVRKCFDRFEMADPIQNGRQISMRHYFSSEYLFVLSFAFGLRFR